MSRDASGRLAERTPINYFLMLFICVPFWNFIDRYNISVEIHEYFLKIKCRSNVKIYVLKINIYFKCLNNIFTKLYLHHMQVHLSTFNLGAIVFFWKKCRCVKNVSTMAGAGFSRKIIVHILEKSGVREITCHLLSTLDLIKNFEFAKNSDVLWVCDLTWNFPSRECIKI